MKKPRREDAPGDCVYCPEVGPDGLLDSLKDYHPTKGEHYDGAGTFWTDCDECGEPVFEGKPAACGCVAS
jgi:hypothetical protein